jgi:hypothetical protein
VQLDHEHIPEREAEKARYLLHQNAYDDTGYRNFITDFMDVAISYMQPHCRVLDFGSGPVPVPSRLLEERGFRVARFDPFFAPDESWRNTRWDAILVHEVAEHLAAPRSTFELLASIMNPGGILCVRTRFMPKRKADFTDWAYRQDTTHTGFFSVRTALVLAGRLSLLPTRIEEPDRILLRKPYQSIPGA